MNKQNITEYSDEELSLIVLNDEYLYRQRNRPSFIETVKELFIYTDEQLEVLKQDIAKEE